MNKLPQKYETGVFNKILNFFRNIFGKKVKEAEIKNNKTLNETSDKLEKLTVDNSINEMKQISKQKNLKEDILGIVMKNPATVDKLSKKQLKSLDKMLDEEISKNNNEIEKLKQKYEKLVSTAS